MTTSGGGVVGVGIGGGEGDQVERVVSCAAVIAAIAEPPRQSVRLKLKLTDWLTD